jgi:membrane protease YdiL (CAAX protease family)
MSTTQTVCRVGAQVERISSGYPHRVSVDPPAERAAGAEAAWRPPTRRDLFTESALVLGVGLGASAVWSVLSLVNKLTQNVALNQQTTAMNSSVTPDRPWLDLAYQLVGIAVAVVPAVLALYLLGRDNGQGMRKAARSMGFDFRRPGQDLWRGTLLTAAIGIPGLGLYLAAKALGFNTTVAAANLTENWWTVPVLVLAAVQNSVLEEVVMIGYLYNRWLRAGWSLPVVMVVSALIRGSYHLYQGFGGFVGNVVMGLVFGWLYTKTRRVGPLVVAHTLLDVVAFVGYALLRDHLSWLT